MAKLASERAELNSEIVPVIVLFDKSIDLLLRVTVLFRVAKSSSDNAVLNSVTVPLSVLLDKLIDLFVNVWFPEFVVTVESISNCPVTEL